MVCSGTDEPAKWYKFDDGDVSECKMDDDEEMKSQCFGGDYVGEVFDHMLKRFACYKCYCMFYRANRRGFTSHCHDLDTFAESTQHNLFRHSHHSAHCLNHLYIAKLKLPGAMKLRVHGHDFELPTVKYEFNKRNFIVRSLFQYV